MSGSLTIAHHEVARRWPLLAIALALTSLPMLAMAIFGDDYYRLSAVVDVCMIGAIVLSWIVAFVIGMGLLGRPLHDGRLAFYFTRPVGGFAIAFGKLAGGAIVILAMELLLVLPILDGGDAGFIEQGPQFALMVSTGFLAAGLIVGILARSRSRWFLLDAIGGTTVAFIAVGMFDRINDVEMQFRFSAWWEGYALFEQVEHILIGLVAASIVSMLVAVVVAIAIGRTDRERVHRALSITLWSCLVTTALAGLAVATWGLQ